MLPLEEQLEIAQQVGTTRSHILSNLIDLSIGTSFLWMQAIFGRSEELYCPGLADFLVIASFITNYDLSYWRLGSSSGHRHGNDRQTYFNWKFQSVYWRSNWGVYVLSLMSHSQWWHHCHQTCALLSCEQGSFFEHLEWGWCNMNWAHTWKQVKQEM